MTTQSNKSQLVGIREIAELYLPLSPKRIRQFVSIYLDSKKIGGRIYVEREKLEALLRDENRDEFPLNL